MREIPVLLSRFYLPLLINGLLSEVKSLQTYIARAGLWTQSWRRDRSILVVCTIFQPFTPETDGNIAYLR